MYKIAVVGPESTGKSVLAEQLATYYGSPWVPEYARTYIEKLSRPYNFDDIREIAKVQIVQEEAYETNNPDPFVFFDTDLIITKVWFDYCYQQVPAFVTDRLKKGFFDLYLLCEPDLPWEPDPVREHGHDRDFFFDWYKSEIEKMGKPYICINGTGQERIQNAIEGIDNIFETNNKK